MSNSACETIAHPRVVTYSEANHICGQHCLHCEAD